MKSHLQIGAKMTFLFFNEGQNGLFTPFSKKKKKKKTNQN